MTDGKANMKVQPGASLRTQAIDLIRREISEGRIAPGARLIERDLCDALGVSRTVVREAIRHLEAEGYVSTLPRQGPIVAPMDLETVRSIYEIREELEARAAALFVQRATAADKLKIREICDRLVACEKQNEHVDLLAILKEFQEFINTGSGNILLNPILIPLNGRIHMLAVKAARSPERRAQALAQIQALTDALVSDDPDAAAAAAKARLRGAAQFGIAQHRGR